MKWITSGTVQPSSSQRVTREPTPPREKTISRPSGAKLRWYSWAVVLRMPGAKTSGTRPGGCLAEIGTVETGGLAGDQPVLPFGLQPGDGRELVDVLHHPGQVGAVVRRIAGADQRLPGLVGVAAAEVGVAQFLPVAGMVAEERLQGLDQFEGLGALVTDDQARGQSDAQLVARRWRTARWCRRGPRPTGQGRLETLGGEGLLEEFGGGLSGVRWLGCRGGWGKSQGQHECEGYGK